MKLNWLTQMGVPVLAAWGIQMLGKTMTWFTVGGETVDTFLRKGTPVIIVFWHGRQLMMPLAYRGKAASILISQHRDGEIIASIMKRFGFDAVRGSSSRGGMPALRRLVKVGRQGRDLVVTPDGPRGPALQVQLGVIALARMTGFPIIPLTFACSKKKSFQVGTAFNFPILGQMASLFGEILFGWGLATGNKS